MNLQLAFFIFNKLLNTAIIIVDILIIWAALKTKEIKRNLVLHIIITAIVMDIGVYLNTILHDVPSFCLNTDISPPWIQNISVLILCMQWFSQLLYLPVLSIIHFVAIFAPTGFWNIPVKYFYATNIAVLMFAFAFTVPFFTSCCGYAYFVDGHYWYFDFNKPQTRAYTLVNLLLQAICVGVVIINDALILWRIFRVRYSFRGLLCFWTSMVKKNATNRRTKKPAVGREVRLAVNFLMLSVCFLIMTVCFNINGGKSMWHDIAMELSSYLNLSKWAVYALGNIVIRSRILRIFGIRRVTPIVAIKTPSVVTKN